MREAAAQEAVLKQKQEKEKQAAGLSVVAAAALQLQRKPAARDRDDTAAKNIVQMKSVPLAAFEDGV